MKTTELKKNLIARINEIEDLELLQAITTILDKKSDQFFPLSGQQKLSIEKSRQQIKGGDFLKNEEVFSGLKAWLKKK
jgi:hypothetical protein